MMQSTMLQWRGHGYAFPSPVRCFLRDLCVLGLVLVVLVPAARGQHALLGWWPLWLVGMPAVAWWMAAGGWLPVWGRREDVTPVQLRRAVRTGTRRHGNASRSRSVTTGRGRNGGACASVRAQ